MKDVHIHLRLSDEGEALLTEAATVNGCTNMNELFARIARHYMAELNYIKRGLDICAVAGDGTYQKMETDALRNITPEGLHEAQKVQAGIQDIVKNLKFDPSDGP